jgi:hypothetical protein
LQKLLSEKAANEVFNFDVTIRGKDYEIDLNKWKQINKVNPSKSRDINRDFIHRVPDLVLPRKPFIPKNLTFTNHITRENSSGAENFNNGIECEVQSCDAVWMYEGKEGRINLRKKYDSWTTYVLGWRPYSDDIQMHLEQCYVNQIVDTEVYIGGTIYEMNLVKMKQKNTNDPTRVRKIKREFAPTVSKTLTGTVLIPRLIQFINSIHFFNF